ncbi:MAG: molybdopterin-dependent oxidoreductase, partial [Bacteroidetes bacterium]|nr:molybdopterin-dependent oxidoreductase [Bacteroidota bacterium]
MKQSITRRDLLKISGGGILGMMLSPLPWKLLDDSAIWTQNWERTPKLSHGPLTIRYTNCALCNAGCGMTLKCVDGRPYYVSGVQKHPFTGGALCARGIAGHQMANHPLRIVHPHTFTGPTEAGQMKALPRSEAIKTIADKIRSSKGSIVILDQQPNRVLTSVCQDFLAQTTNGILVTSPASENRTADVLKNMVNDPTVEFGYDFEHTTMVISFSAPLFDGWGIPGRMSSLRTAGTVKFIQIEDRRSRTAMQSDEWISIVPGMERYLALSIANVLLREQLIVRSQLRSIIDLSAFKNSAEEFTPEATAPFTGVPAERVRMLARELASARSSIILSGADAGGGPFDDETERLIASLNVLLGNVGRTGGIVSRRPIPGTSSTGKISSWSSIPDHSIEVLIIDAADSGNALPWKLLEQKLVEKNRCV